jgi:hypothetical protein
MRFELICHDTNIDQTSRWLQAEEAMTFPIAQGLLNTPSTRVVVKTIKINLRVIAVPPITRLSRQPWTPASHTNLDASESGYLSLATPAVEQRLQKVLLNDRSLSE